MDKDVIHEKLLKAQELLGDIYYDACQNGDTNMESLMSVADSLIWEALDWMKKE